MREEEREEKGVDVHEQETDGEDQWQEISRSAGKILHEAIYPQITPVLREIDLSVFRSIQQQAEFMRQIQSSIAPVAAMIEAQSKYAFDSLSTMKHVVDAINFSGQLQGVQSLLGSFAFQPQIAQMLPTLSLSRIEAMTSGLSTLIGDLPALRLPVLVWNSSLDRALEALTGIDQVIRDQMLTVRMLEPYMAMGLFLQATGERLEQVKTKEEESALAGSLLLAQEQAIISAAFLQDALQPPQGRQRIIPQPPLNSLGVQQEELLKSKGVPTNPDYATLLSLSPAAAVQRQISKILALVAACNDAVLILNPKSEHIFKPTNRVLASYAQLPWIAVVDHTTLGSFIDGLFFIFYEGAGSQQLRFMRYLGDAECRVIWALKHLRNRFLRHDPEHGAPTDIRKAWTELREDFAWLGVQHIPLQTSVEYQLIQQRVLDELEQFLSQLLAAINAQLGKDRSGGTP